MNWMRDCAAVIPCVNEGDSIGELVRAVRKVLPLVIVVDDGSTDVTASEAVSAGAEVLRLFQNRGKGAALREGFTHARSQGCTWALTLDGDGQHHPDDIPALLGRAEQGDVALVVGNRLTSADRMPWLRRNVNRWMSRRLSKLAGEPFADSQCGLRLVNLDAWSNLKFRTEHFEFESELLVEFVKAELQVAFVRVQVFYGPGQSRIRPVKDSYRWLRWWLGQLRRKHFSQFISLARLGQSLSGQQDNASSVGQLHLRVPQSSLKSEPPQFVPAKAALD